LWLWDGETNPLPSPPQTQISINSRPTSREFFVLEKSYAGARTSGGELKYRLNSGWGLIAEQPWNQ